MISEPKRHISKKAILKLKDLSAYPFMNLTLTDIAGEEWLDIPQFDGYYLISNYGRIKALSRLIEKGMKRYYYSKERIVSQSLSGFYNKHIKQYTLALQVSLHYEKKVYRFMVHRLMYDIFIGNIDFEKDKLKIVHKDGDNLNNKVDNLETSDSTTIFYKTVKNKTRPTKPTHSDKMYNQIGVIQYDLAGNVVQHFVSVTEAAKALQTKIYNLKKVLTNRIKHFKGFVLRYETDTYNGEYANYTKTKKVSQYTKEGKLVKIYDSVIQASDETGISHYTISRCALLKVKFASGFVWRYEGDIYEGDYTKRVLKVVVRQYEKNGNFIKEFESASAAASSLNLDSTVIFSCINGKIKTAGGYVWRSKDQPYKGEYADHHSPSSGRPITQLDEQDNIIATFKTITAASKATGVRFKQHDFSVKFTYKGFQWRTATQDEIEQISILPTKKRVPSSVGICQYTKQGEKIASYDSMLEATKNTGVGRDTIRRFLNNPNHVTGKYIWRREGEVYAGELENVTNKTEARIVTQYDLKGNKVNLYTSTYEVTKLFRSLKSGIGLVLNGVRKSAGGFIWQYGDGPEKLDLENYYNSFGLINSRSKTVSSYDLEGNKKGHYKSLGEAARQNNIPYISISNTVNGKSKSAFKLIWILGDGPDKIDVENYLLNGDVKAISK